MAAGSRGGSGAAPGSGPQPLGRRQAALAGSAVTVPLLVGVIPFGLVFGATASDAGHGLAEVLAFSSFIFAGASQLAAVDLLSSGSGVAVAVATVWVINLRHLMYGASLGPHLSGTSRRGRVLGGYLLTDQAYAVTIARITGPDGLDRADRVPFLVAAGATLWAPWQLSCLAGAVVGAQVPDAVPLEFAVPLVFLTLLVPTLADRPSLVAALVGGAATVAIAEAGLVEPALLLGALTGVAAGTLVDARGPS